jgi:RNA 2',3'-cyclic 3'-phosphodiesterase
MADENFQSLETPKQEYDGPASWRCFIAIEISGEVRENAARLQSKLRRANADVSFPDPQKMHLTIVFLGDTLTGKVELLKKALDAAVVEIPQFNLNFKGLGFFGPPRHPRVLWAGVVSPFTELSKLNEKLLANVTELGFSTEKRAFRPHLTMGRIRSGRGLAGLTTVVDSLKDTVLGCSRVERVLLMRSHLDQPKASYESLHEAKLTGVRHATESRSR